LYVPKNIKIEKPLQAYFRINTKLLGQFERTLIILEEGAEAHYFEGCTATIYDKNNLHAAVVEIFVGKNAKFKYSTIQN
jgi:Fe-S cluster assembly protein SufB